MPPSSAAARSLALAVFGVGAASFTAQGQNVTAFNPYSGAGLPGRPVPQYGSQAAHPIADPVGPAPTTGPAFNPWSSPGRAAAAAPDMGMASPGQAYDPSASLPPPPSGSIKSRIVAIPELTTSRSKPRDVQKASTASVAPAPARVPAARPVPKPETPAVAAPATASAPPPAAVARPAAPPVAAAPMATPPGPQSQMAAAAPAPSPPPAPPARNVVAMTVAFTARSTALSDASKAELDRLAREIAERTLRQVELRTVSDTGDPDNRKISLARALIVRNYLIDKGVRSRIEIAAIVGGGGDRVEILVPRT